MRVVFAPGRFGPNRSSRPGRWPDPAFCVDMTAMIARHQPFAWVHGHMHSSADYRIGRTRVLNDPHGYGPENATGFDPALILDTKQG